MLRVQSYPRRSSFREALSRCFRAEYSGEPPTLPSRAASACASDSFSSSFTVLGLSSGRPSALRTSLVDNGIRSPRLVVPTCFVLVHLGLFEGLDDADHLE